MIASINNYHEILCCCVVTGSSAEISNIATIIIKKERLFQRFMIETLSAIFLLIKKAPLSKGNVLWQFT